MQLRNRLRYLVPEDEQKDLPMSVVEDCGTIDALTKYVIQKRHGEAAVTEDEEQLMLDLIEQYSRFGPGSTNSELPKNPCSKDIFGETIILTGATGALGAHVLDLLRASPKISRIYCLVRGADVDAAKERTSKSLHLRGLNDLSSSHQKNDKIVVIRTQLSDPQLGLKDEIYSRVATEVDLIIHVAWTVSFRIKLRSFVKDNIAGVKNLLELASKNSRVMPPRFVYYSSAAAVMNKPLSQTEYLAEEISTDPSYVSPLGYSRSKWVAEQICWKASQTTLKDRIAVVRVGQLSGNSRSGAWNTNEAWPMMLSTVRLTGSLPALTGEPLDWLPVDVAAQALLEVAASLRNKDNRSVIYHVLNEHREPMWLEMLQWLKMTRDFDVVSPETWVAQLEQCQHTEHPALRLLGLWKEAYCNAIPKETSRPRFAMVETKKRVPVLRHVQPVNEAYMAKIWAWIQANVH